MIRFHGLRKINTQYTEELKSVAVGIIDLVWCLMGTWI